MNLGRVGRWWQQVGITLGALSFVLFTSHVLSSSVLAAPGNSAATITGSFGESCRDFTAFSTKDISHVEVTYLGGYVEKDEDGDRSDLMIDGDAGEEIESVLVKSGTTVERFGCDPGPPAPCSDGVDNDGNGLTDYPADPGCAGPWDNDEGFD